jgi:hypothetical protein
MPSDECFCCPNCGGRAFGTTWDGDKLVSYNCSSDKAGTPMSMTNEEFEAGILTPKRKKPCGWRGKEFSAAPPAGAPDVRSKG